MNSLITRFLYLFFLAAQTFCLSQQQTFAQQSNKERQTSSVSGKSSDTNCPGVTRTCDPDSIQTRVKRGELPFSRLYEYVKPSPEKEIRLPKLSESESKQPSGEKIKRVGTIRKLKKTLNKVSQGTKFNLNEGEVWIAKIISESAVQIRLHFNKTNLSQGAKVFVYSVKNPDEVYVYEQTGAAESGDFWTPPLEGESIIVEYFLPKSNKIGQGNLPFQISEISHIFGKALD